MCQRPARIAECSRLYCQVLSLDPPSCFARLIYSLVQVDALETLIVLESEAESRRNEVRPLLAQHATAADLISIAGVIDPSLLSRSDSSFRR